METGRLLAGALWAPGRTLAAAVERRRVLPALVAATVVALAHAAVLTSRLDVSGALEAELDAAENSATLTPHQREEQLTSGRKVAVLRVYAGAAFGPALRAVGLAVALWLGFAVAARRPAFGSALTVASWAQLPLAGASLLAIPALLVRTAVSPAELATLLPSHLGALARPGQPVALAGALGAVDLFALWAVALTAIGMQHATGATRRRAVITTVVLWLSYVAVFHVALPSLAGGRS